MRLFEAFRLSRMLPQYWLSGYLPVVIPFWAGRRNRTFLHFLNIRNQQCQVTPLTDCLAFSQILVFRLPLIFKIFFSEHEIGTLEPLGSNLNQCEHPMTLEPEKKKRRADYYNFSENFCRMMIYDDFHMNGWILFTIASPVGPCYSTGSESLSLTHWLKEYRQCFCMWQIEGLLMLWIRNKSRTHILTKLVNSCLLIVSMCRKVT